jgi:hypothetical protein
MRELGRKGGRASHAARRGKADKHASVYLRERVQESPELIWRAFKSAIESDDPRISSRGASLLLSYLPAPDRENGDVLTPRSELDGARERLAQKLNVLATRHIEQALVNGSLIAPGVGDAQKFRPFVCFELEELARWSAAWPPFFRVDVARPHAAAIAGKRKPSGTWSSAQRSVSRSVSLVGRVFAGKGATLT